VRLSAGLAALAAALCACVVSAAAQSVPIPSAPTAWVTDGVGLLSTSTRDALDQKLQQYESSTGHQVIVWIGSSYGDDQMEDWTSRAFEAWKVGRKGIDDGAILFVFVVDRKARIEVGYGLEDVLTDARSSEIIRDDIAPRMRSGDPDGAVTSAVDDMLAAIGGAGGQPQPNPEASSSDDGIAIALIAFVIVMWIVGLIASFRRSLVYHIPGSRYGGIPFVGYYGGGFGGGFGGGGFGGGFSGGGGMGGGGGASGGW
jgi:uncharacterized protein